MTIKEYLKINAFDKKEDGTEMTHEEKYTTIVNALGYEQVKRCLPFTLEEIKKALPKDENLNNLSIKQWQRASGVYVGHGESPRVIGSTLTRLYHSIGITCFSQCDGVCVLKQCARMYATESVNA